MGTPLVGAMGLRRCVKLSRALDVSVEAVDEVEWAVRWRRRVCGTGVGGCVVSMNFAHARSR